MLGWGLIQCWGSLLSFKALKAYYPPDLLMLSFLKTFNYFQGSWRMRSPLSKNKITWWTVENSNFLIKASHIKYALVWDKTAQKRKSIPFNIHFLRFGLPSLVDDVKELNMIWVGQDQKKTPAKFKANVINPPTNIGNFEENFKQRVHVGEGTLIAFIFHVWFLDKLVFWVLEIARYNFNWIVSGPDGQNVGAGVERQGNYWGFAKFISSW